MKKTTYMVIGLLLAMILTTVIGLPMIFDRVANKYAVSEIVTVDSIKGYTGETTRINLAKYSGINFDNYSCDSLFIDVIFNARSDSSYIAMDNMWYDMASIETEDNDKVFTILNQQSMYSFTTEDIETEDGKIVSRDISISIHIDSAAHLYATVMLPASTEIRSIEADDFTLRVYGTVPQGFNIKSTSVEFCGDYTKPENN